MATDPALLLRILGDQTRLRIIAVLEGNELTVSELTEVLHLGQSTISTQLSQLRDVGIVLSRKEGQFVYYRMASTDLNPFQKTILDTVFGELNDIDWSQRDKRTLQAVLDRRQEASFLFFQGLEQQNRVSPGQTWESLSRGLCTLVRGKNIADMGCGNARLAALLCKAGNTVSAVDSSPAQIEIAQKLHPECVDKGLTLHLGSMDHSGLEEASFDIVIVSQSLHHIAQPQAALKEAARILRDNGQILILDLLAHDEAWIQQRFADFWLGFEPVTLEHWLKHCGFQSIDWDICGPDPDFPKIETLVMTAVRSPR